LNRLSHPIVAQKNSPSEKTTRPNTMLHGMFGSECESAEVRANFEFEKQQIVESFVWTENIYLLQNQSSNRRKLKPRTWTAHLRVERFTEN
jgi:hypothetical protein